MDIDYGAFFGAGFLLAVIIPVLIGIVGLIVTYLIIRAAVRGGLRDHYKWVERNHQAARAGYTPITGPVDPTD